MKKGLAFGIILLFIISSMTPLVIGYNQAVDVNKNEQLNYDSFHVSEIKNTKYKEPTPPTFKTTTSNNKPKNYIPTDMKPTLPVTLGLMNSSWPMFCHDTRHTGRSPYTTSHITSLEKWNFYSPRKINGGAVVDNDGIIYFGDDGDYFYALYPNGTLKWKYDLDFMNIVTTPAIDEDGTIYVGTTSWDGLLAFNQNGTLKWRYDCGAIYSSPSIGIDGTIYFGTNDGGYPDEGSIYALNPNGTLKWQFRANHVVYSSPAIGDDGSIYCGSHDEYLYALYPNGTLKWKFKTGHWVRVSPCIGDDGTIYFVSLDENLYAVYPNNGTLKWATDIGAGTHPTIGPDGTIYGGWEELRAINPDNGELKWTFIPGDRAVIEGACPITSDEGIIYFGTRIRDIAGGHLISLNPDGTEIWRKRISYVYIDSPPCIGPDGTVYIGSAYYGSRGFLHAFGPVTSNDPPSTPNIDGPPTVEVDDENWYQFLTYDPDNNPISFYIDWGDGDEGWSIEWGSGEDVGFGHTWSEQGNYTIRAKAKDVLGAESDWGYLEVTVPVNQQSYSYPFLELFRDRFPVLYELMMKIMGGLRI